MTSVGSDNGETNFDDNQESYLIEQLPPVPTWGYNFFVFPDKFRQSFVRIVASQASTMVYVNQRFYSKLNQPGKFIAFPVSDTAHVTLLST